MSRILLCPLLLRRSIAAPHHPLPPSLRYLPCSTSPSSSSLPNIGHSQTRSLSIHTKMLQANRLKQAMDKGPSMGLWQMLPGANISRALARTPGIDWVMVDCEHGTLSDASMHEAVPAIAAMGISPIVRIPDFQSWMVKRALDSGAHGILVPLIRTVDEVKAVVSSAKFPPEGTRGFGSPFSAHAFATATATATGGIAPPSSPSMTEYLQQANAALLTMVQIETREALDRVDEIAPLVDVLFVGPFDLGNNIGEPILDGVMPPRLEEAIEKVRAAAERAGRKSGIYCASGEQARQRAEQGFHMVTVATDVTALQAVVGDAVAVARGKGMPVRGGSY